jgi:hypothetical protein
MEGWLRRGSRGTTLVEHMLLVALVACLAFGGWRFFGAVIRDKATAQAECVVSLDCGTGVAVGSAQDSSTRRTTTAGRRVARWAGYVWSFVQGLVWDGLVKSLIVDSVVFIGQQACTQVTDPYEFYIGQYVDMARGARYVVTHRDGTWTSIKSQLRQAWQEDPARFSGRAVFEAATFVVPWLKLGKVKTITNVTLAVRTVHRTHEVLAPPPDGDPERSRPE